MGHHWVLTDDSVGCHRVFTDDKSVITGSSLTTKWSSLGLHWQHFDDSCVVTRVMIHHFSCPSHQNVFSLSRASCQNSTELSLCWNFIAKIPKVFVSCLTCWQLKEWRGALTGMYGWKGGADVEGERWCLVWRGPWQGGVSSGMQGN